jgi:23S rRNA pseudouridine2605 synthase
MRIHRALARAGVASRRHAEVLVAAGRVLVNGTPARVGQSVDPRVDKITVDGRRVAAPAKPVWILLNKPAGVLTTASDPGGRPTVFGLVEPHPGLTYVGRLDYMTEGLLLLTTDGDAAHHLTHPRTGVPRTYEATVRGDVPNAVRSALRGVHLDEDVVEPFDIEATPLGGGRWTVRMSIAEGRNREVRRICEALGLDIERLVRIRFGPLSLGSLASGASRSLTSAERKALVAILPRDR